MINKVRPQPADDPFKRGQSKKIGGGSNNKEEVEKTHAVDPEEQRKKFQQYLEEKSDIKTDKEEKEDKRPSPYESSFYETTPFEENLVKQTDSFNKALEEEKNVPYFQKIQNDEEPDFNIGKKPKELPNKKLKKTLKESQEVNKKENFTFQGAKKNYEKDIEKKPNAIYIPSGPIDVPFEIMQRAAEITSDLKVNLNAKIAPLFEQMVGRFLVMSAKEGIMQTELTLDNPEMENSVFYGSKITLEKYSTAPDSFNVKLTGSPEAVALFNDNIQSLMAVFHRGNFNFRINSIIASLEIKEEEHLFRRKKKPTSDQTGGGPLEK